MPPSMPSHMIKEVVQVIDDDTYIVQESIFNQRYESEDMGNSSNGSDNEDPPVDESNEEHEDRIDSEEDVNPSLAGLKPQQISDEDDDDESEVDDEAYGQHSGLIIAAGGAIELIQPMMAMEDNLLGPNGP
eukprot:CAMPEP_0185596696 /NCGR_PEP_ID=MMETSP0434-20130131/80906_1 /TAXON_ID=626734 ORGANISM="Favella taraikaensis, Strain Fe Narragansett Bay" /NCGR_SAMPLE_ID=MMETSP0434 /ASSEMBLY_ACC=CAM_ASM_000379 /LENGTH=130 /DNA_ID=CAMNT_0028225243 /DNA_START=2593 /DNA_END=2985 /DNA_ORIENTATION=-